MLICTLTSILVTSFTEPLPNSLLNLISKNVISSQTLFWELPVSLAYSSIVGLDIIHFNILFTEKERHLSNIGCVLFLRVYYLMLRLFSKKTFFFAPSNLSCLFSFTLIFSYTKLTKSFFP